MCAAATVPLDLGLLVFVTLTPRGPTRLEALPLKLGYCRTRAADCADAAWIRRRAHSVHRAHAAR